MSVVTRTVWVIVRSGNERGKRNEPYRETGEPLTPTTFKRGWAGLTEQFNWSKADLVIRVIDEPVSYNARTGREEIFTSSKMGELPISCDSATLVMMTS